jgi:hypothetical protein
VKAHKYYNVRLEMLRKQAHEVLASSRLDKEARNTAVLDIKERGKADDSKIHAESGVFWGTYLCIDDASTKAIDSYALMYAKNDGKCQRCDSLFKVGEIISYNKKADKVTGCVNCFNGPKFRRWEGVGTVACQIQKGMTGADLLACNDRRARLYGEGKHRVLWLRVGSEGIDPIWAKFPIVYHRSIPSDAVIKWVKCKSRRVGSHIKWEAYFVLEGPQSMWSYGTTPSKGRIAIDVGWRQRGDDLRVATWVNDLGEKGELLIPALLLQRDKKVDDLKSIRDKTFNEIKEVLMKARNTSWPTWLYEKTKTLSKWKSKTKLARIITQWRECRELPELYQIAEEWRYHDRHLQDWECHQRESTLNQRQHIYRLFAKEVSQYKQITIEKLDLAEMARVNADAEKRLNPTSREHRFDAGLSILILTLKDAAYKSGSIVVEADPYLTTQWCHDGDHEERFDAAPAIAHMCSCGISWDQDVNAARNLLDTPPRLLACQLQQAPKKVKKSNRGAAVKRREKGLETRRATAAKKLQSLAV